jgi:hypothetical protein
MPGETPLGMMRPPAQRVRKPAAARVWRGRRPIVMPMAIVVVLAIAWVWLWYYAATVADRTLAGWVEREAAAGRVYSCGAQSIGGFPLGITARCAGVAAEIKNAQPPYDVKAKAVTFAAEVYRPTRLTGEVVGPVTLAELGQQPSLVADWKRARVSVRGVPPDPDEVSFELKEPRVDHVGADAGGTLFKAERVDLRGRVIAGSSRNHPVIEATVHLVAATAPELHPLLAAPIDIEVDAVLRGFKDLAPKPWAARFREMQADGGDVEIKALRFTQGKAIAIGAGKLSLNERGKLDGVARVAVAGLEQIVPLLGFDQTLAQGIDRLSGAPGTAAQGMDALDRLIPGLGGALRESANASLAENLKKIGEPTAIDKQPAVVLPLRFADGAIYLGMLRIGEAPPLF